MALSSSQARSSQPTFVRVKQPSAMCLCDCVALLLITSASGTRPRRQDNAPLGDKVRGADDVMEDQTRINDASVIAKLDMTARRCDFANYAKGVHHEVLTTHDALFTSASGKVLVVQGRQNPRMRVLAFMTPEGKCEEQSVILCKDGIEKSCNPDPTPLLSCFNSMIGALNFFKPKDMREKENSYGPSRFRRTKGTPLRVLSIGLGAGEISNWVRANIPDANHNAVDVDGEVIEAATTYLGLPSSVAIQQDGCQYIANQPDGSIDIIFMDAFGADNFWPPCFLTQDFMQVVKTKLTVGGLMSSNVWPEFEHKVKDIVKGASMYMKQGTCTGLSNLVYAISNKPLQESDDVDSAFRRTAVPEWFRAAAFHDVV